MNKATDTWPQSRVNRLVELRDAGASVREIGAIMVLTPGQVAGKIWRLQNPDKGKTRHIAKLTPEQRQESRRRQSERMTGPANPAWRGGAQAWKERRRLRRQEERRPDPVPTVALAIEAVRNRK